MAIDHISNCLGAALKAAQEIHISMCRFDGGHAAQANLNNALHNVLIVAEECRQAMKEPLTPAPAPEAADEKR